MTTRAQLIIQLLVKPPLQPVSQPVGRQHLVRQRDRIEQDQRAASRHDVAHALAAVLARGAAAEAILAGLVRSGRLASPALVTVELARGTDIVLPEALRVLDRRRYGKADLLILGHAVADEGDDADDTGTAD